MPAPSYAPTVETSTTSSSSTAQGTSTTQPASELARLAYEQTLRNAGAIAQTPYEPYTGQQVARLTDDQLAAMEGVRQMQGIQNPYLSLSGDIYQQMGNTWQNPMLGQAQQYYGSSFGYVPNQYMPQVGNYTTNALANAANQQMGAAQGYTAQSLQEARNAQLSRALGYMQQGIDEARNAQMAAAQGYTAQSLQEARNAQLANAQKLYGLGISAAQNAQLPAAQNYFTQAMALTPNQQMQAAESYAQQAMSEAMNPELAAARGLSGQAMSEAMNPELAAARGLSGVALAEAVNPELAAAQQYFGASFGAAANPLLAQSQNFAQQAALASLNPALGAAQDYLTRSTEFIQNPELARSRGLMGESVGISEQERFNQQALNRYMNPFQQSVVDATLAQMKQNQDVLQNQNVANAIRQGAFGGSGQFMGQAELGRQQALANAQTLAQLNAQNYAQAMQQYNQQQQQAIQARQQAAQVLGQLGQSQAGLGVQGLQQAAQTAGQLGQGQAGLSAQTLSNLAQTMGQLGQSQAGLNVNALQQAAQTLGQLGQSQAGLRTGAAQQAAQLLGQLGQSQAGLRTGAAQQAAQLLGQLGQSQAGLRTGAAQQAAQLLGQLGQSQAGLQAGTATQIGQALGQLGQSEAALQSGAIQQAAQGLGQLGQSEAAMRTQAAQQGAQLLGQLGQSEAAMRSQAAQQAGQTAGQLGQSEAAMRTQAAQQAAQTLGQLGQQQAALQAGTGMQAAQLYGELGNALANRGIQAYQSAAQNLGQLGQQQQALGVQALNNVAQGVADLGKQAQAARLTDLQALLGTGQVQQQLQQAQLDRELQQWLQAKAYPYQQTSYFAGLAGGLGPLLGQTGTTSAQQSGTTSSSGTSLAPYQSQSSSFNPLSLITSGLGLISGLPIFKKDGGRIGYEDGGLASKFGSMMASSPYEEAESVIDPNAGFGSLMMSQPYEAPNDYITEASKLSRVIKPASEIGRQNVLSNIEKVLDQFPGLRKSTFKGSEGNLKKLPGMTPYGSEGSESDSDSEIKNIVGSIGKLSKSPKAQEYAKSGWNTLTSFFNERKDGGRLGYADGGTPQQQANQVLSNYQSYLGRTPDQPGFDYFTQQAAQGASPEAIAAAMINSPERGRAVRGAYVDALGRSPDPEGAQFWENQARQGMSLGDIQGLIQSSPEAVARAAQPAPTGFAALDPSGGLNKAIARERMIDPLAPPVSQYDMMLQKAMARNPGPQLTAEQQGMPSMPGADYYSGAGVRSFTPTAGTNLEIYKSMGLPEKATVTTAASPYASADAAKNASLNAIQAEQVRLAYAYTAAGVPAATATVLAVQNTQGQVAEVGREYERAKAEIDARIAAEPKVEKNVAEQLGLSPNYQNFVTSLYKNYLGRDPSQEELKTQLQSIVSGAKPADLEAQILASPEGSQTQNIQKVYESSMGRQADLGGLAFWKQQLAEGVPLSQLSSMIASSPEARASSSSAPVQGYYKTVSSGQVNPYTGLFNMSYTAPYRGRPVPNFIARKDGGRIGRATGGRQSVKLSMEEIARAALQAGATPQEAAILTAIAMPESSGVANILNNTPRTGDKSYGLWQINMLGAMGPERMRKFGLSSETDLFNPVTNAKAALELLRGKGGLKNWTTYTSGKYRPYYSQAANVVGQLSGNKDLINRPLPEVGTSPVMSASVSPTPAAGTPRRRTLLEVLVDQLNPVGSAQAAEADFNRRPMVGLPAPETIMAKPSAPLPDWKQEVKTGFGPLQGEKPADPSQLLMAPTQRPNMGPEMPAEPVVAQDKPQAGAKSGQKYWGDWRDVEPFKSDPIGGFFDDLMGEKPMADKPGTLDSAYYTPRKRKEEEEKPFDLGDLFPFANGGIARNGYAVGGEPEEEEFDPLGDIGSAIESGVKGLGDAFGGLFGETETPASIDAKNRVVAEDRRGDLGSVFFSEPRPMSADMGGRPLLPPSISKALLAAGLGMMASPHTGARAVGEGGLKGFQVYAELSEQERKREEDAAKQRAAERYERQISGEPMSSDEAPAEKIAAPAPIEETAPATPVTSLPKTAAPVSTPDEMDIESDPTLRRLSQQYARVASIPAPTGMASTKSAQLANLKFQIEERRRQLESSVKARKAQEEAKQKTPEAKARAKMLETEQEALAKEAVGVEQAARQADQRIATLGRMKEAVESGRFSTGFGAETKLGLEKAVQSIFPKMVDEEAIAMAEQFEKDALQAVTDATGGKLGAGVSDSDVRFLTRQQAGLGTSKAGNVRTLDAAIKIEQRKKDIAQFARDYREAHGGVLDQGYYKALSDWSEANPLFPKESGKAAASPGRSQYTPEERAKAAEILRRRREGKQ